ncbi:PH domain-containing protein [Saccharopolyspora sp. MS10]|uniref:PH domain-containing protein n=1 Tax=Saccharopolyspora sp. MS10 TaxID=3385973 RepID=UPI0039A0F595
MSTQDSSAGAPVRLRPPRHRVERRAVGWWSAQAAVLVVPPVVVLAVLAALIAPARPWLLLGLLVVVLLGLPYLLVMPRWRYRVHRWESTEHAVYTAAGWVRQEWRVAPMSRIQTVDSVRGPLQRAFGLASVTVTTASAAGALRIDGLDHRVAEELVERLTATTQAVRGDAT